MTPDVIRTARLDLVPLTVPALDALIEARWADAAAITGVAIPAIEAAADTANFMRRRGDVTRAPGDAEWYLRAIVLRETRLMVGRISFHGPPEAGVAELGYNVHPAHRRRGVAREAAEAMMSWAVERGVHRMRLSISPDNAASLALAKSMGFVRTGEQMDPEDGLEWVFERRLTRPGDRTT